MKVRIGYGFSGAAAAEPITAERYAALVDGLERHRFDSLWLTERVSSEALDPLVGLAVAAGRTTKLKLGTAVMVLPGRNPVLLAKELASLDRLSDGRLLPGFGLGAVAPAEQAAFGVAREERSAWFDEALPLIRRLWSGEPVDHHGPRFTLEGVRVRPTPVQDLPEVWLGGMAAGELRRCGRLGEGWLPSFMTPAEVADGRVVLEEAATAVGREVDPEHYGALVQYARRELPARALEAVTRRRAKLPEAPLDQLVPVGLPAVRRLLERFVEVGFSKFVLLPVDEPPDWDAELGELAAEVLPLQV